jgi:hypothetical protein
MKLLYKILLKPVYLLSGLSIFLLLAFSNSSQKNYIKVTNAQELQQALDNARAGLTIELTDNIYIGKFIVKAGINGTKEKPIVLKGSSKAILQPKENNSGYALHLQGNECWILQGFTLQDCKKGLVIDNSNNIIVDNITVNNVGEEAIHLRSFSSYNIVRNCSITNVGLLDARYGEGVYIGTAISNWPKISGGKPDTCNYNLIENNIIGPYVAAEAVDVKEGTFYNIIRGNTFYGKGQKGENGGDSWIDVKGSYTLIENNKGYDALEDGYQVHIKGDGFGCNNIFRNNHSEVNAKGYAINIQLKNGTANGNIVYNNNTYKNADKGLTNISTTKE